MCRFWSFGKLGSRGAWANKLIYAQAELRFGLSLRLFARRHEQLTVRYECVVGLTESNTRLSIRQAAQKVQGVLLGFLVGGLRVVEVRHGSSKHLCEPNLRARFAEAKRSFCLILCRFLGRRSDLQILAVAFFFVVDHSASSLSSIPAWRYTRLVFVIDHLVRPRHTPVLFGNSLDRAISYI